MLLTKRMQIQAIANRMAGFTTKAKAAQFTEPWALIWRALDEAPPGQDVSAILVQAVRDCPDRDSILGAVLGTNPGASVGLFQSLEELAKDLLPVEWVWYGWIPRGMITLIGAVPGAGKSFLALDLAKRLIEGSKFPDGQPTPRKGSNVIYVDAEAVPQLLNERAQAWEMDRSRMYLMLPEANDMLDFGQERHRDRLTEMVAELEPELVILDSLSSISSKGENNVEDVRVVLGFLNALAQDYQCGLGLIHHLRKGGGGQQMKIWDLSIDDFRGSGHIIAMARSVIGLSVVQTEAEQNRNGPRKVEIIKTNLGPYPDPLGFEFKPLEPSGVFLQWGKAPHAYQAPTMKDECKQWLEETLKAVPEGIRPAEVVEMGAADGYSRAMVYRTREELEGQIENTLGRQHPENMWKWIDK